ncbi:MAG: SGNH/GDSL hydrolase family protein [Halobacteriovoraceae bacterium]|jgi:hypothetical protein|nr:SGNH/GDSL hydrolase family protein [Halobacteriovoraceae bacterium]MBT5093625.1 SGNH/GDSL hydrolase family protein [Halobacteriovoraceae bacterium]
MKFVFILGVNGLIFISLLLLGELGLRLQHLYRYGSLEASTLESDPLLGWKTKPNFILSHKTTDVSGNTYTINYRTDDKGFRQYGDLATSKKKILIIGDSFTHARHVSNEKLYYHHLNEDKKYELFAYGVSGYGNYQELLVLKKYIDSIRPDIIFWQFCINDFSDNHFELNKKVGFSGIVFDRPYLNSIGNSQYFRNSPLAFLTQNSRLLTFLYSKYLINQGIKNGPLVEIKNRGDKAPSYTLAQQRIREIFVLARKIIPATTKVYGFLVNGDQVYDRGYQKWTTEAGFTYIAGLAGQVSGSEYMAEDGGHWNERGHLKAGRYLADYFK